MALPAPGATPSGVASERIAEHLRTRILSGELAPGSRIMQEEIAAELGSSRLPVREALRIVEAEGLIVHKSNSGSWVAALDLNDCVDVYKMRERLEPLALTESLPNLTTDDVVRLERLEQAIEQNSDVDRFLALDREFHLITYSGCRMDQLLAMVHRFWNTTQHYRRAYAHVIGRSGWHLIHAEHGLILDAIKRGDATDAERYLAGHIRRTRMALAAHPEVFHRPPQS